MDAQGLLLSYLLLSGGHSLGHLDAANKTGAPAKLNWRNLSESWENPKQYTTEQKLIGQKIVGGGGGKPLIYEPGYATVKTEIKNPEETERQAGGFTAQDKINNAVNTPESNLANAIFKALYAAGVSPKLTMKEGSGKGDIKEMKRNSGNKNVGSLLLLSALADIIKARYPEKSKNVDLDFTTIDGAPGLLGTYRF